MRPVVGDVPLGGSPYPPIADYAFLSDCEVCALVAPSGNVEWMCLPRFDGPSIFGAVLDRDVRDVLLIGPWHHDEERSETHRRSPTDNEADHVLLRTLRCVNGHRALCEKMLGYASPLNLYAEEIDARSGRHLGNFPQAFTHLALINAVMHVIRADQELAASQPLLEARHDEVSA